LVLQTGQTRETQPGLPLCCSLLVYTLVRPSTTLPDVVPRGLDSRAPNDAAPGPVGLARPAGMNGRGQILCKVAVVGPQCKQGPPVVWIQRMGWVLYIHTYICTYIGKAISTRGLAPPPAVPSHTNYRLYVSCQLRTHDNSCYGMQGHSLPGTIPLRSLSARVDGGLSALLQCRRVEDDARVGCIRDDVATRSRLLTATCPGMHSRPLSNLVPRLTGFNDRVWGCQQCRAPVPCPTFSPCLA
jgi:hypothetical protein